MPKGDYMRNSFFRARTTSVRTCARVCARAFLFFAIVFILFSTTGCGLGEKAKPKNKIVIGFSIATDTFIIERWNKDVKIFTGAARDLGADVIVQLSAGGTKEQIAQINFLLTPENRRACSHSS